MKLREAYFKLVKTVRNVHARREQQEFEDERNLGRKINFQGRYLRKT
jgi:hypothetical protein